MADEPDEPSALQAAKKLVDEQIKLLEIVAGTGDTVRVAKESAILAAYSRREGGTYTMFQVDVMSRHLTVLTKDLREGTKAFGDHMTHLSREINVAGTALSRTDESTKRLADRTKWLVVATVGLALATIIAALVGAIATWKLTSPSGAIGVPSTTLAVVAPTPAATPPTDPR